MNIQRFDELAKSGVPLAQLMGEWRCFLEFAQAYFTSRNIAAPLVVEVGTFCNAQRAYYRKLLNAEHIGIDIVATSGADIIGDSHSAVTMECLKSRLAGRPIDLLFIDGDHSYAAVKQDYEMYSPLAKHLVAMHDVFLVRGKDDPSGYGESGVRHFWQELGVQDKRNTLVTFSQHHPEWEHVGIGVVIKEQS